MDFSPPKIKGLLDFLEMIEKFDFDKIPAFKLSIDAFLIKSLRLAFFILNFHLYNQQRISNINWLHSFFRPMNTCISINIQQNKFIDKLMNI
jgi:hypothetical protein